MPMELRSIPTQIPEKPEHLSHVGFNRVFARYPYLRLFNIHVNILLLDLPQRVSYVSKKGYEK